jgi:hypothetical protein
VYLGSKLYGLKGQLELNLPVFDTSKISFNFVKFEVFVAVTMKNAVFWDMTPCGSYKSRHFGERIVSIIRVERIRELGRK